MATPYERVASDPELRRLLGAARAWGMPLSTLVGQRTRTTYTYDGAGRLLYSDAPGWSTEDADLAIALMDYEAGLCKGCGHPLEETTAPDAEEGYDVRVSAICHCCTAFDIAQGAAQKHPHPSALLLSAVRRAGPDEYRNQGEKNADQLPPG